MTHVMLFSVRLHIHSANGTETNDDDYDDDMHGKTRDNGSLMCCLGVFSVRFESW